MNRLMILCDKCGFGIQLTSNQCNSCYNNKSCTQPYFTKGNGNNLAHKTMPDNQRSMKEPTFNIARKVTKDHRTNGEKLRKITHLTQEIRGFEILKRIRNKSNFYHLIDVFYLMFFYYWDNV